MATEHDAILDPEIHEPKGVAAASSGQFYIANGTGSGEWRYIPHSACYYDNIGTGITITTPTAYTLIGPTTTGDTIPRDYTHNSLGRLTYTGTSNVDANVHVSISFKHSTGSGQDCFFQVHINGSPVSGAQHVASADSANYNHISLISHVDLATNDYLEVFCKTASGSVIIHAISITAEGKV